MSKIFYPYIYHGSIAHKYYLYFQYKTPQMAEKKMFSALFSTGIRELFPDEYENAYIRLLDQMLLYDVCSIPVEDVIYLIGTLGFQTTMKLVQSPGIQLFDALSNRIGTFYGPLNQLMMFNENIDENERLISKRIDKIYEPIKNKFELKFEWKNELIKLFKKAYFIDDTKTLFEETKLQTIEEINKFDVRNVLYMSPVVTTDNIYEEQYKANRLLHYHYYRRIASLLLCDYIYVPVELEGLYNYYSHLNTSEKDKLGVIFEKIIKLERLPDLPSLIKKGILTVDDILQIRESSSSVKFRRWIDALNRNQANDVELDEYISLYHDACMTNNKFKTAYVGKVGSAVRTIGLTIISAANSGLGLGLTFVDYLISIGLDNYNPASFTRGHLKSFINKKTHKS
ncbi:MAG: hypothetical protein M0Q94_16830 [Candidatus Cloacimonetes bacterium]|nr:hypothetical protein [Candidatus Cloacimonadota bacterium]